MMGSRRGLGVRRRARFGPAGLLLGVFLFSATVVWAHPVPPNLEGSPTEGVRPGDQIEWSIEHVDASTTYTVKGFEGEVIADETTTEDGPVGGTYTVPDLGSEERTASIEATVPDEMGEPVTDVLEVRYAGYATEPPPPPPPPPQPPPPVGGGKGGKDPVEKERGSGAHRGRSSEGRDAETTETRAGSAATRSPRAHAAGRRRGAERRSRKRDDARRSLKAAVLERGRSRDQVSGSGDDDKDSGGQSRSNLGPIPFPSISSPVPIPGYVLLGLAGLLMVGGAAAFGWIALRRAHPEQTTASSTPLLRAFSLFEPDPRNEPDEIEWEEPTEPGWEKPIEDDPTNGDNGQQEAIDVVLQEILAKEEADEPLTRVPDSD